MHLRDSKTVRCSFFPDMLRLSVALLASTLAADSEGTSFHALFFRNQLNSSLLELTFVNGGSVDATVNVTFFIWNGDYSPLKGHPVPVKAKSSSTFDVDPKVIYPTIGPGFNIYPDLRIKITSNVKISVYAVNLAQSSTKPHKVGDTYLVLPDSMAGSNFVVSLPDAVEASDSAALWQMKVLFFIPINDTVQVTVDQYSASGHVVSTSFPLQAGQKSDLRYFAQMTGFGNSLFKIHGDGKFLVLAGVTCAPEQSARDCDFAAFMPPPTPLDAKCGCAVDDQHPTYAQMDSYFLSAPASCSGSVPYTVFNEGGLSSKQSLSTINSAGPFGAPLSGKYFLYSAASALLQMTRVGDRSPSGGGLYLDIVPATSQFLTGSTSFDLRSEGVVTIAMLKAAAGSLKFDGVVVSSDTQGAFGCIGDYCFATISKVAAGFHTVSTDVGSYSIEVQVNVASAYTMGFVPAYNTQHSNTDTCIPVTVPPTTTTSPATPSQTTTDGNQLSSLTSTSPSPQTPPLSTTTTSSTTTPPATPSGSSTGPISSPSASSSSTTVEMTTKASLRFTTSTFAILAPAIALFPF
ncbi:hypothetical protein QR680_016966 [Steinernema hermaphroditum]|uniref:IgGFc-binding protein N-terminal domain-containing protein n=1 Tax=Steinernema hermaphroditum TaxID=289476 RepID=A0AA39HDT9_9BILA|nr:hypothetical protein QR680_016966 [Steinernema hermaphroditum]